jgi:hypothetical protein
MKKQNPISVSDGVLLFQERDSEKSKAEKTDRNRSIRIDPPVELAVLLPMSDWPSNRHQSAG